MNAWWSAAAQVNNWALHGAFRQNSTMFGLQPDPESRKMKR